MALSGQQYTIRAGEHEATIAEVGASLRRYTLRGVDVTSRYAEDEIAPKCSGAVLVPWPNRLRGGRFTFDAVVYQLPLTEPDKGNAIHGLARWVRWTPLAVEPASVTLGSTWCAERLAVRDTCRGDLRVDAELGSPVTGVARNTGFARRHSAPDYPYLLLARAADRRRDARSGGGADRPEQAQLPIRQQAVGGTPDDFRRARRLQGVRLDDRDTRLSPVDGRGSAEVRTRSGGAALWFDSAFRLAGLDRSGHRRRAGDRDRADDLPARRVQFRGRLIVLELRGCRQALGITRLPSRSAGGGCRRHGAISRAQIRVFLCA